MNPFSHCVVGPVSNEGSSLQDTPRKEFMCRSWR